MSKEIHSISGISDPKEIMKEAEHIVKTRLAWFDYVVFAEENLREIIRLARTDWDVDAALREFQRRNRPCGAGQEDVRPDDDLLAVDFLKHRRTNYDWQLDQIQEVLFELEPVDEDGGQPSRDFLQ